MNDKGIYFSIYLKIYCLFKHCCSWLSSLLVSVKLIWEKLEKIIKETKENLANTLVKNEDISEFIKDKKIEIKYNN